MYQFYEAGVSKIPPQAEEAEVRKILTPACCQSEETPSLTLNRLYSCPDASFVWLRLYGAISALLTVG